MARYQPVQLAYTLYEPEEEADESLNPVIFAHGVTECKEHWYDIPQFVANATKRKAYALDFRNHGDSEWSDVFSFDMNADDLLYFMDERRIQKAIVVGHSMGGISATKAALKKPDRFEKVVVEDMTVSKVSKEILDATVTFISLEQKGIENVLPDLEEDEAKKFIFDYMLSKLPQEEKFESEEAGIMRIRRGDDGRYVFCANLAVIEREMKNYDTIMSHPQGVFEGPTCFIYGSLSPFQVQNDEEVIKKHFPNAVLVRIDGATHSVHVSKSTEFKEELLKFLS